jgi:hypothetical protein
MLEKRGALVKVVSRLHTTSLDRLAVRKYGERAA